MSEQQEHPPFREDGKEPSPRKSVRNEGDGSLNPGQGPIVINEGRVGQQFISNNMRFGSTVNIGEYKEQRPASEIRRTARDTAFESRAGGPASSAASAQSVVFISYSREDAEWLKMLHTHLAPLQREGLIDLRDDTKILAGTRWRTALQEALESVEIAIMLVSTHFLASDFIADYELPAIVARADEGKTQIISLIVSHCDFKASPLEPFQTANDPKKPLKGLTGNDRDQIFMHVTQIIRRIVRRNIP